MSCCRSGANLVVSGESSSTQRRLHLARSGGGCGINFDAIEEHKTRHGADAIAIIGPSFTGGRVSQWAKNRNVRLIDVPTLVHYLRCNDRAPLSPSTMAGIFEVETANPKQLWDPAIRRQTLLRDVVLTLWQEANDDREVARSGGGLDVSALRYLLRDKLDPDPEEIQEILEFLASPVVQSVRRKGEKYFPLEPPAVTAARLSSLGEPLSHSLIRRQWIEPARWQRMYQRQLRSHTRTSRQMSTPHWLGHGQKGRESRFEIAAGRLQRWSRGSCVSATLTRWGEPE